MRKVNLWLKSEDGETIDRLENAEIPTGAGLFELNGRRWQVSHTYVERYRDDETTWVVCLDRGPAE